jgi:hypothetical protein
LDRFWEESAYAVNADNVFHVQQLEEEPPPQENRHGRSYVEENLATHDVYYCHECNRHVTVDERMTIRAHVFHRACLHCAVCGASPRTRSDYVTYNGKLCCSAECVRQYDGAHVKQLRK